MDRERLGDDRADRLARVQRRVRVLEDHLHLAAQRLAARAPRERRDVAAVERDRARSSASSSRSDQPRGRRLAAARLADDAERLALADVERRRRRPRARRRPAARR